MAKEATPDPTLSQVYNLFQSPLSTQKHPVPAFHNALLDPVLLGPFSAPMPSIESKMLVIR